ncbi:hypothetical protein FKP32DRAFT_1585264, partial [Trametes sanguinea]
VTIKPDGTRRDDVNIQDEEWIAQVSSLAVSDVVGPIAKYTWFLRQTEVSREQCSDNATKSFITSVGAMELLALQHETITTADTIHDIIPVETFDVATVSLRVLDSVSYYCREKTALLRVLNTHYYRLSAGGVERACRIGCLYGGHFNPDEHVMRFCMACELWYHIPCMEHASERAPTLPRHNRRAPTRPPQPEDAHEANELFQRGEIDFTGYQYTTWTTLLRRPIQRGHVGYPWLLSFELLLHAVRAHDRAWGCPSDVQDFVTQHLSMAPSLVHLTDKFRASVQNGTTFIIYICPGCEQNI